MRHDENNVPTNVEKATTSKRKKWKGIWKIQAVNTWHQPNDYICGPIALNRFAFELRRCQHNEGVDERTLQLIQSQDQLKERNLQNAADLLEHLLKTKMSVFGSLDTEEMISDSDSELVPTMSIEDESLPPNDDNSSPMDDANELTKNDEKLVPQVSQTQPEEVTSKLQAVANQKRQIIRTRKKS